MVQQKMIAIGVAELRPNGLLVRDEGRRIDSGHGADCETLGETAGGCAAIRALSSAMLSASNGARSVSQL